MCRRCHPQQGSEGRKLEAAREARVVGGACGAVDPVTKTADVQGMCTYEDLVDATLPYGLAPLVVPQLKTITLGGAVAACERSGGTSWLCVAVVVVVVVVV